MLRDGTNAFIFQQLPNNLIVRANKMRNGSTINAQKEYLCGSFNKN